MIQQHNAQLEARVRERTAELEQANREIDQIAGALRLSEGRLRLILDAIPAMIAPVDAGRRYRFANRAYAQWFGLSKEGIVGRSILEVFGDEAYAVVSPHLSEAEHGERVSYEYARKNADGHTVHARSVVVSARIIASDKAFSACGRLSVIRPMPPGVRSAMTWSGVESFTDQSR